MARPPAETASIEARVWESYLERFPLLGLGPAELASRVPIGSFARMGEMQQAAVVRAASGERQLYELMCEFWWHHFDVGILDWDCRARALHLGHLLDNVTVVTISEFGHLVGTTDYRSGLGEILLRRCGVGSLGSSFADFRPTFLGPA